jgi:hypothetical protein
MTTPTTSEHHHEKKKYPWKKAFLPMIGRTCSTSGWLGLLYFLSFQSSEVGIILSIVLIVLGDFLDVYSYYS